jgi:Protein of unknown function (DUF1554)
MGNARGFIRVDGKPFADTVTDITQGKILNALILDNVGNPVDDAVWTGTTNTGTTSSDTCSDWTSNSNSAVGEVGLSRGGPDDWSDDGNTACNSPIPLYCFDTSHTTALTVTPVPGRIAFVSKTAFDTSTGVAGADTLCQNEATAASLPGSFRALLATTTVAAADPSRFDLSMGSMPYVRPDGIKIADAPTIASGAALDSGIWQNADGTYVTGSLAQPWTGSTNPSTKGTETCTDWTTKSVSINGLLGDSTTPVTRWWNSGSADACSASLPVYCLEQ